tara:strand:+ start:163 stop:309 length:147 start_codon:yes stop_codon:yes gene_type:complete
MGKDKYDEHLEQQRLGREAQRGWKALFKHSVVGPLVIGAIIGGVGYIF